MKNIHVLPTDKPSRLHNVANGNLILDNDLSYTSWYRKYIYITSDEEIKEGYYYDLTHNIVMKSIFYQSSDKNCKKIILTTDQDLIKDGVQAIDDEFLEWFVDKANDSGKPIDIVKVLRCPIEGLYTIIPKEEIKLEEVFNDEKRERMKELIKKRKLASMMQDDEELGLYEETLEEAAYQARRDYQDKVGKDGMNDCIMFDAMKIQKGFELGAKWQQERSYSEEEVLKLLLNCPTNTEKETIEWFEQFKKK
jgi:hypothetical protein